MSAYLARLVVIVALIIGAAHAMPAHAQELPPVGPFPDRVCNLLSRTDFYHAPDGTIWECVCELLPSGRHICDWYEQGHAPVPPARPHRRRIVRHAIVKHRVVVRHALPPVVA